uniref:uncharacterized protein LOC128929110 n=1 Tax=Callithrix jacchus TaxID=9483 RepID=UPI0023DD4092|nr:uncharacterized protein LOC128929110 [Callithrix jacchus]
MGKGVKQGKLCDIIGVGVGGPGFLRTGTAYVQFLKQEYYCAPQYHCWNVEHQSAVEAREHINLWVEARCQLCVLAKGQMVNIVGSMVHGVRCIYSALPLWQKSSIGRFGAKQRKLRKPCLLRLASLEKALKQRTSDVRRWQDREQSTARSKSDVVVCLLLQYEIHIFSMWNTAEALFLFTAVSSLRPHYILWYIMNAQYILTLNTHHWYHHHSNRRSWKACALLALNCLPSFVSPKTCHFSICESPNIYPLCPLSPTPALPHHIPPHRF